MEAYNAKVLRLSPQVLSLCRPLLLASDKADSGKTGRGFEPGSLNVH